MKQGVDRIRKIHEGEPLPVDSLTLQMGPETYSLIKYNSFTVGPVTVTVKAGTGETAEMLYERASKLLNKLFLVEYEDALNRYLEHVRYGSEKVQAEARG